MLFNEFGPKDAPAVLLMHGMMQDWRSEYALLKPLEEHYRLIIPAMDGFYDGSGDFTSFADQARQIEEYINRHHGGKLHGAYGASQGGLLLTELLTRNKAELGAVIMDGCYVAHQGKLTGIVTAWMFKRLKKTGKLPSLILLSMKLMGLKKEDLRMMDSLYMSASDTTIERNFIENYTYRPRPEITENNTPVHLWCGSREPYALKSHRILKKHLRHVTEEIMPDLGHGDFLLKHTAQCCAKIRATLEN